MELLRRDLRVPTVRAESVRALEVPEGMVWVSMEDGLHCRAGAEVSIVGAHVMGRRALIMEAPGRYIAAKLVSVTEAAAGVPVRTTIDTGDPRLLGDLQYEANGSRGVEYSQAVQQMRQEELPGWPLLGDRTTMWLCKYIYQHGGTPDGRQTRWATEQRIDSTIGHQQPGLHGGSEPAVPADRGEQRQHEGGGARALDWARQDVGRETRNCSGTDPGKDCDGSAGKGDGDHQATAETSGGAGFGQGQGQAIGIDTHDKLHASRALCSQEFIEGLGDGFFPIQKIADPVACARQLCRSVRQRVARRNFIHRQVGETVDAINSLAGRATMEVTCAGDMGPHSRSIWARLWQLVSASAVLKVDAQEALVALLGSTASVYSCADELMPLRPYERDKVSWPERGSKPRPLQYSLGGELRLLVEGRLGGLIRSEAAVMETRKEEGLPRLHHDQALKGGVYAEFIREAHLRGVVRYGFERRAS
eukprot:6491881-Amphidinium_carterae.1